MPGAGSVFIVNDMRAGFRVHSKTTGRNQMDRVFFALLELWNMAGVCLVLLIRRHRKRLEAGYLW
jgi:hypothetical protein